MDPNINSTPLVSVLMPVFNGEKYLTEAIESILTQTYTNFEFVIINDGSTDTTEEIIKAFSDSRIRLINNTTNIKLIATLNKGIQLCNGKYIVRMDADDVSLPDRIEVLVGFMEHNPDVGVCGSYYKIIGDNERVIKYPTSNDELKTSLLFFVPIAHPTTIWRKEVIAKNQLGFDVNYIHAEDYKFWTEIIEYSQLGNVPEILLNYREHNNQISSLYADTQKEKSQNIRKELLQKIFTDITVAEFKLWEEIIFGPQQYSEPLLVAELIKKIVDLNAEKRCYDNYLLMRKLALIWKNVLLQLPSLTLKQYCLFNFHPLTKTYGWTLKQRLFLFLKIIK